MSATAKETAAPRPSDALTSAARRSLLVHLVLLAASVAFAWIMWTDEDSLDLGDFEVWDGAPEQITKIEYAVDGKEVTLEARTDDQGRWFAGVAVKPPGLKNPHAPQAADNDEIQRVSFVSVGPAQKVTEALAPLRALRAIGQVGETERADYGLAEPAGSLTVTFGDRTETLQLGSRAPGGQNRYAMAPASGEVYLLAAAALGELDGTDTRLMERDLHAWAMSDVAGARVTAGERTLELVRTGEIGKRYWAEAASPDAKKETVGNWMATLAKLRPQRYEALSPTATALVRVDFKGELGDMGYVELLGTPPDAEGKATYWIRSEHTREAAIVSDLSAAQLTRDLDSILP